MRADTENRYLFTRSKILIVVLFLSLLAGCQKDAITTEKRFIEPTAPEWLYANGQWKEVLKPNGDKVMQGWLDGKNGRHYGRRARIETDSSFATLKQRGIGGTVFIFVDGKQVVTQKLDVDGKPVDIPIYKNKKGWHQIEIGFSNQSEIDGLFVSEGAKVRKPEEKRKRLIVIGHSHADGTGTQNIGMESMASVIGDIMGVESINQGIGRTDIDISSPPADNNSALGRVKTDVIDLKPDYVLSIYGFNSISTIYQGKMTHEQYQEKYMEFIKAIHDALPDTKVFASSIMATPSYSDEELKLYNEDIKIACSKVPNCTYIDLTGKMNEGNFDKYMASDRLHPSTEGQKYLAEEYAKSISAVLGK
ncbi:SGNH/GDSL hydrolase family protein [Neobacillus sp. SCS-31]|uniref:SGNH/GDSL hydrolase family protein n=1 Tax=Neobacillus oceani TaxID=3115292 RepID=UPI003905BBC4